MKKKLLAVLLAGTMAATALAGCGGGSGNDSNSGKTDAGDTQAGDEDGDSGEDTKDAEPIEVGEGAGIDSWVPFEENVTISVPVYDRGTEGTAPVDDNYYTKWINEEFGAKYNVTVDFVAIPRTDVMTKYSMLIAGGQTPTILMEYDYPKVAEWVSDGAMQEIDLSAFAQVAPDYYNAMVENDQLQYTDINGGTYFVLTERPYYNTNWSFATVCRKDWLDEVGLDVPQNYTEWTAAVDAIMEAGLTDTAPIGKFLPNQSYIPNFAYRDYPVDEAEWAMHSSLGTPSFTWEPSYRMIKRENAEYNKGYYSTEFELDESSDGVNGDQVKADFINGNLFEFGDYIRSFSDTLSAFYENNPDAELALVNLYKGTEEGVAEYPQIRADNPFGMIVGFANDATEDQLTAAWMYMEWLFQEENLFFMENGVEGKTFEYDEAGLPVMLDYSLADGEEALGHSMNIDYTCIVHASKKVGTIEDDIRAVAPTGLKQDLTQDLIDNFYNLQEIAENGWAYSDPVFSVDIAADAEYQETLRSLYQQYYVQLLKCDPDEFDDLYEQLAQDFLNAGYQEVIDERLEQYEAGNSTKLPENHGK